jgi:acetate kinase
MCCEDLQELGINIDEDKNQERRKDKRDISAADSRIRILVIPTNEEKRIARETKRVIEHIN